MKNLTTLYIVALSVIALVIIASQYLVQKSISSSLYDAHTINIAGRQSMLSQKLAKTVLQLREANSESEFLQYQAALAKAGDLWEKSHNALQYGDEQLELDNVNNSEKIFLLFLDLEEHYIEIKSAVEEIARIDWVGVDSTGYLDAQVERVLGSEQPYQALMDQITLDYDDESAARLASLSKTEYALLAVALILLILEAIYIFQPAIKRINDYTNQLLEKEKSLQVALEEQKKEKEKVEYLNKQADSIFENVDQGLFLIDEKFMISELYSKSMESIFEEKNLAGTNFIQLMRPRLVKRDQDALEMFVKHLYNAEIEEEVLIQLNPVEQVEIYSSHLDDATIDSRFIEISFARIRDQDRIYAILVTISDVTETVTMQRRIAASEEKNKKESMQLLNILRVEPAILRDYLGKAKAELSGISERYEKSTEHDFRDLLNFTFTTIHNLKGNATMIDLELVSEKLHSLEDTIVKLRDQPRIEGRDFLKILYEVNDLILTVQNMQRLLARIAEVNTVAKKNEQTEQSDSLKETLTKGLAKLAHDQGRKVNLIFEDGGKPLPDQYKVQVSDVLVQLFRNTLAHGLESKKERLAMGKNPQGEIIVKIDQTSDQLTLSYRDDGKGLNLESITYSAIEKGLITDTEALVLSENEKAVLIMQPGFSTYIDADQLAGRGQGMSIISDFVEKSGGSFELSTDAGGGFRLSIVLPLVEEKIATTAL